MIQEQKHIHKFEEIDGHYKCECGKTTLKLNNTSREGVKEGTKFNGVKYTVRDDRSRYFYPLEWLTFIKQIKDKKSAIFETMINTGARIDEALHIRPKDFDFERHNLTLYVTKVKAAKKEKVGKRRTFKISTDYSNYMKKHITKNKIQPEDRIFNISTQSVWQMLRRGLKRAKIEDWYNFGTHNLRKTHGNFLKAIGIPAEEICLRLGHDFNTYLRHYGSATIFDYKDRENILKILGDLYYEERKR